jgi:hypothetical protein
VLHIVLRLVSGRAIANIWRGHLTTLPENLKTMKLTVNRAELEVDDLHAKTALLWVLRDVLAMHGFSQATHVVDAFYELPYLAHAPMEPQQRRLPHERRRSAGGVGGHRIVRIHPTRIAGVD